MSYDPVSLNCAIVEAFGIDPKNIRPNPTIRLDRNMGPIITVEYIVRDHDGKMFAIDGELATVLRQYKLVPLED